ncbi:MAG TPA: TonB-dependent receptor plug domain-containing protein [Opitutaceae bacterium]|nr:TonB-dependent receptor plug domain-containing protein [Opitutaceae bacterium]
MIAASLMLAHRAGAQATPNPPAPPPSQDEAIQLSPFVIQTNTDVGYEASSSLAGTGLNTKLTDLGASVSVITAKFLEDTGSKNLSDVLVYQTNMEVRGFGGNYTGVTPSPAGISSEPSLGNGPTGTRVRGLAEATQARNFYRSIIPMDGYNTDRVEINRGANALLFGVGSPAGIINSTTISADLRKSRAEVEASAGSYGSWRLGFDFNAAPSSGTFAVRVAGVKDEEKYQQNFAFTDTERKFATATWDVKQLRNLGILDSTTIRASFEKGNIESNSPRVLTPSDRISSWFDATIPDNLKALGVRGKATYDPGVLSGIYTPAAGTAAIGTVLNVNRSATFVFQDAYTGIPRDNTPLSPTGQTVLGRAMVSNNVYFHQHRSARVVARFGPGETELRLTGSILLHRRQYRRSYDLQFLRQPAGRSQLTPEIAFRSVGCFPATAHVATDRWV